MHSLLFYFFSGLAILSALLVVLFQKPTRALLSVIITMFSLSGIYLLLGAPFVAMAQLIVYAGAVLVLFLFVIMLQGIGASDMPLTKRFNKGYLLLSCFTAGAFLFVVISLLLSRTFPAQAGVVGTIELVGRALFDKYLLPFELTSILLLAGVFAAVSLAKPDSPADESRL